jgi:predicted AAA+ superfamily ATPase
MYRRLLAPAVAAAARQYRAIVLLGPRQSGKTTLARHLFPDFAYVSLEDPDVRRVALSDPRTLLRDTHTSIILDEVQRAPELLSYLQGRLDDPSTQQRFILTGSQNLLLAEQVSQTLAGRTRIFSLLPMSHRELVENNVATQATLDERLFFGGYPRIFEQQLNPTEWLAQYTATYVERDVRQLSQVTSLDLFDRYLRLLAGRAGQLLNLSSLGSDCGVSQPTAAAWLSILKTSYVAFTLEPHFRNFSKRLIKSPKVYFYDTGLLCYLLRITTAAHLFSHPLRGAIFENWVVSERVKGFFNQGQEAPVYFWRDSKGNEVDLLLDRGLYCDPLEIKSSATFDESFLLGLARFADLQRHPGGEVVFGGDSSFSVSDYHITSWRDI